MADLNDRTRLITYVDDEMHVQTDGWMLTENELTESGAFVRLTC